MKGEESDVLLYVRLHVKLMCVTIVFNRIFFYHPPFTGEKLTVFSCGSFRLAKKITKYKLSTKVTGKVTNLQEKWDRLQLKIPCS